MYTAVIIAVISPLPLYQVVKAAHFVKQLMSPMRLLADDSPELSRFLVWYFETLRKELEPYDCVLYEMVASKESLKKKCQNYAVAKRLISSRSRGFNVIVCIQRQIAYFRDASGNILSKILSAFLPCCVKRVAVVGAGVSGLTAAHRLKSQGVNVTLLEADARAGGKLRTVKQDGLVWDEGANTMTESEKEVTDLIDDLGLREKQQMPNSQNLRYIARNGSPLLIPSSPTALVKSSILSAKTKFKIILEPFLGKRGESSKVADEQAFESVSEFFQRHFGKEFVDYLMDPFLAGTCAGDPESVSMRHAFPEIWNIEKRFGSIIVGAIRSKLESRKERSKETKKSSRQRGSFSFKGGMQTLIDTICNEFSDEELKLQAKVLSLSYSGDELSKLQKWSVSYTSNNNMQDLPFDAVVMTAPLSDVKSMKISRRGNPFSLEFVPEVDYLPLSVIITTFKKANVKKPLEGFGVLIPSKEQQNGLKTLGSLFSSMMFPDRAPSDTHLYTTFVGGSRNREVATASTDELKQIVSSDLRQLLGTEGEPNFIHHCFWNKAFPLYGRNYDSVLNAIAKMEQDLPGFFYAGNHKDGLSVGKAISSGYKAADLVISYLNSFPVVEIANEAPLS